MLSPKTQYNLRNAKEYFAEHLAMGDYYSEKQAITGEWLGRGAGLLKLSGVVRAEDFLALCDSSNPRTKQKLTVRRKTTRQTIRKDHSVGETANRRVFYDFTISPPKSVSIVALVGGDDLIVRAHDDAVRVALHELERFASTRVRQNLKSEDRDTANIVAAVFRHDTSRALDPHLHSHCIVFNATFDAVENRWKALQNYEMLLARKYVENVYYHELSRALRHMGYDIQNTARGDFVVAGIPNSLTRKFGKRHAEINRQTEALLNAEPALVSSNRAEVREHIAHDQRSQKMSQIDQIILRRDWLAQMDDTEVQAVNRLRASAPVTTESEPSNNEVAALEWAEDHLFDRKSLVREHELWSSALERGRGESFSIEQLHAATDRADYIRDRDHPKRLTTRATLQREWDFIEIARGGINSSPPLIEQWTGDASLDAEQIAAARKIVGCHDSVILFRGGAGTGKSFTLRTIHDALKADGHFVQTLAPQRQQVEGLASDGMTGAQTLSGFLLRNEMRKGAVVIVDEAGQIGAKDMLELLSLVKRHEGRVILSGDTRQHGAVQASDALWAIEKYGRLPVAELNEIRRQDPARSRDELERQRITDYRKAVEEASVGDISSSFDRLDKSGWIVECTLANQQELLAREYLELTKAGEQPLVVSPTWDEIHRVNEKVRAGLRAEGLIGEQEWEVTAFQTLDLTDAQKQDRRYYPDDSVIVLNQAFRNHPRGTTATLIAMADQTLVVEMAGRVKEIPFTKLGCVSVCRKSSLSLSQGDRLQLKANAKTSDGKSLLNGELVTVKNVKPDGDIFLEDGRVLPSRFRQFVRGFAVTSYASQGKTVDHVLFSDSSIKAATNDQQWYVTISRGRRGIRIFTPDKQQLRNNAVRSGRRELALDLVKSGDFEPKKKSNRRGRGRRTLRDRLIDLSRRALGYASVRARTARVSRPHQQVP